MNQQLPLKSGRMTTHLMCICIEIELKLFSDVCVLSYHISVPPQGFQTMN